MLAPVITLLASLASARQADDPQALAEEILGRRRYQTELPEAPVPAELPELPVGFGAVFEILAWIVVGALVVALVVWIFNLLRDRRDLDVGPGGAPREVAAEPVRFTTEPLEQAEKLAREGRFGEAIRLLLHLTFEALRGREGVRLEAWLTGREIAHAARLPEPSDASLRSLVNAVELSLFGGREPGNEEYQRCVREYHALLESAEGSAA